MGGSMGSVVGEKFVRACESARPRGVPLVSVAASGGARMQEGILALMQLPKTVCAVEELHEAGCALLGGDDASDDGRRARQLRQPRGRAAGGAGCADVVRRPACRPADDAREAPDDFGLAEQNLRFGHLDAIVPGPSCARRSRRLLRLFGMREPS